MFLAASKKPSAHPPTAPGRSLVQEEGSEGSAVLLVATEGREYSIRMRRCRRSTHFRANRNGLIYKATDSIFDETPRIIVVHLFQMEFVARDQDDRGPVDAHRIAARQQCLDAPIAASIQGIVGQRSCSRSTVIAPDTAGAEVCSLDCLGLGLGAGVTDGCCPHRVPRRLLAKSARGMWHAQGHR